MTLFSLIASTAKALLMWISCCWIHRPFRAMKEAGVKLVVPLISQGDLIGLINLGSRRSEQEYTSDDYKLLQDLSTQAAPALKVAQLVEQQKQEAAERERIQQELRVARLIQQTLLPQELPQVAGWYVDAYYQPARAVGGDFYDFIYFEDGRIAFIVADVTDKGCARRIGDGYHAQHLACRRRTIGIARGCVGTHE